MDNFITVNPLKLPFDRQTFIKVNFIDRCNYESFFLSLVYTHMGILGETLKLWAPVSMLLI